MSSLLHCNNVYAFAIAARLSFCMVGSLSPSLEQCTGASFEGYTTDRPWDGGAVGGGHGRRPDCEPFPSEKHVIGVG